MYVKINLQSNFALILGYKPQKTATFRDATTSSPAKCILVVPSGGVAKVFFNLALKYPAQTSFLLREGSVRVCGDAVLLDFWCGFAEIYILCCGTAVLQYQAVLIRYLEIFG